MNNATHWVFLWMYRCLSSYIVHNHPYKEPLIINCLFSVTSLHKQSNSKSASQNISLLIFIYRSTPHGGRIIDNSLLGSVILLHRQRNSENVSQKRIVHFAFRFLNATLNAQLFTLNRSDKRKILHRFSQKESS